jgi:hypothetical protein
MEVKTCVFRPAFVVSASPPGERDQHGAPERWVGAEALGDLIAVHARHADVEKHDLGRELTGEGERARAIVSSARLVTGKVEHGGQHLGAVVVVVDDQDTPRQCSLREFAP